MFKRTNKPDRVTKPFQLKECDTLTSALTDNTLTLFNSTVNTAVQHSCANQLKPAQRKSMVVIPGNYPRVCSAHSYCHEPERSR